MIDATHDPSLESWIESANLPDATFPIQNLPLCSYRVEGRPTRLGAGIGDQILDLTSLFGMESMLEVLAMPKSDRVELRRRISAFLRHRTTGAEQHLAPIASAELVLPCDIPDYTDFYASIHHATNVGSMFRPDNPLLPNYKWLPVAYHGRASSVVVSGSQVRRPWGELAAQSGNAPVYAPCKRLDYELEIGAFIGPGNRIGEPIPIARAQEHIVGLCLLNDWSARDIQTWEYQPLGPFLAKSFATSISPWVVTAEALEPFRRAPAPRPGSDPQPLPHLATVTEDAYDITLEVWMRTARMAEPVRLSHGNFTSMYWTLSQMVAHHTSNGCPLRPGDLLGSGTVSGLEKSSRGCLLELAWRGTESIELPTGETRAFLEDGDEVILRGWCDASGYRRIGFGECRGVVLPAVGELQ